MPIIKSDIPFVTIAYNNYTFIKQYVEQVLPYTNRVIIIDNNSTYPKLLEYYDEITKQYVGAVVEVIRLPHNYGHDVYKRRDIVTLPTIYCLSDPDIEFNKNLPDNFVGLLLEISNKYKIQRVGFAIQLDYENFIKDNDFHIKKAQWEATFWLRKIPDSDYEMYKAEIDTTFLLINQTYPYIDNTHSIRVAGNFTCRHLPWYDGYMKSHVPAEEIVYWKSNNISSSILNQ